jgi:hypothetical protein
MNDGTTIAPAVTSSPTHRSISPDGIATFARLREFEFEGARALPVRGRIFGRPPDDSNVGTVLVPNCRALGCQQLAPLLGCV